MDFDNEEKVRRLLKSACKPVAPPHEFKSGLRQRLILEVDNIASGSSHSLVGWTRSGLIVAAAVISAAIVYGVWLSLNVVPALVP